MLLEKEIHSGFRNARFLMILSSIIAILIYFLLFFDKIILITTDAQNINIGGSSYEGLSYFYYILYGILIIAFIMILIAQVYIYSFLKPKAKGVLITSTIFIGLLIISMILYIIPIRYLNVLFFGADNSNQGYSEVGALLTIGNYINKVVGDNFLHLVIFYLTLITVIFSLYLINYSYYKIRQTFGLTRKNLFISPIILIISWINYHIISSLGATSFYSLSSTEHSMMIFYFLYLTSEAIIYLSYMGIFIELTIKFSRLKYTPSKGLIVNQTNLTKNSLYN